MKEKDGKIPHFVIVFEPEKVCWENQKEGCGRRWDYWPVAQCSAAPQWGRHLWKHLRVLSTTWRSPRNMMTLMHCPPLSEVFLWIQVTPTKQYFISSFIFELFFPLFVWRFMYLIGLIYTKYVHFTPEHGFCKCAENVKCYFVLQHS